MNWDDKLSLSSPLFLCRRVLPVILWITNKNRDELVNVCFYQFEGNLILKGGGFIPLLALTLVILYTQDLDFHLLMSLSFLRFEPLNTKRPFYMALERQVMSWDRHKNVLGLNRLRGPHPSPSDNLITNNIRYSQTCLKGQLYIANCCLLRTVSLFPLMYTILTCILRATAQKGHIFRFPWVTFIYRFNCIGIVNFYLLTVHFQILKHMYWLLFFRNI
jgi:hypothetical protein